MKKIATLLIAALWGIAAWASADMLGTWTGSLDAGVARIPLVLHLDSTGCSLDSPAQGASGIPCTRQVDGNNIDIGIPSIGASYRGTIAGDSLKGTFTQGGHSLALTLTRKAEKKDTGPHNYREEQVTFGHGNVTLAGTLTLPKGGSCVPAVVLVTGSGPQDRDETIMGHKPFKAIADSLGNHGIAVLRYDDRGVGGSSMATGYETTRDFALDATAAVRYLLKRQEIDPKRTGYIGHSEGGSIAILNHADVAFVITLAAPAVKGKDLMIKQNEMIAKATGNTWNARLAGRVDSVFTLIDTCRDQTLLKAKLGRFPELKTQVGALTSPWYRAFVQLDPTPSLKAMGKSRQPMMACNGEWDDQVNCDQNLGAIARWVPCAAIKRYPQLNHLFQHCDSRDRALDYGGNSEDFNPQVIADIVAFIKGL